MERQKQERGGGALRKPRKGGPGATLRQSASVLPLPDLHRMAALIEGKNHAAASECKARQELGPSFSLKAWSERGWTEKLMAAGDVLCGIMCCRVLGISRRGGRGCS